MSFKEIYAQKRPVISLEFFPPKQDSDLPATFELMRRLSDLNPDFMTVTYGAGGSTRDRTREMVAFIRHQLKVPAVAHMTCVGHTREELETMLANLKAWNICHVLALRGDPPQGSEKFEPTPGGFTCARDLTKFISSHGSFSVAIAGYPEVHPEAVSADLDLTYLKEKVDAGAELILTQLFFENQRYFDFVEKTRKVGISVPVVPGIMPITNVQQLERFTSMCGASVPAELKKELDKIRGDKEAVRSFGTEYAVRQCMELLSGGAPGLHIYTLNKSAHVERILEAVKQRYP